MVQYHGFVTCTSGNAVTGLIVAQHTPHERFIVGQMSEPLTWTVGQHRQDAGFLTVQNIAEPQLDALVRFLHAAFASLSYTLRIHGSLFPFASAVSGPDR